MARGTASIRGGLRAVSGSSDWELIVAFVQRDLGPREFVRARSRIEVGPEGETCLLRVGGELDLDAVAMLERELHRLLSADIQSVILDLSELQFIDSTGLHCLLRAAERSRRDGDRLRIITPESPDVDRLLRLIGIRDVLPIIR